MNKKSPTTISLYSEVNSPILKNSHSPSNDLKTVTTITFNENVELISPNSLHMSTKKSAKKKFKNIKKNFDLMKIFCTSGKNLHQILQKNNQEINKVLFSLDAKEFFSTDYLKKLLDEDKEFKKMIDQKYQLEQEDIEKNALDWNLQDFSTKITNLNDDSNYLEIGDILIKKIYLTKDESILVVLSADALNIFNFKDYKLLHKLKLFQLGEKKQFDIDLVFPDQDDYGFLLFLNVILKVNIKKDNIKKEYTFEILCIGNKESEIKANLKERKEVFDIDLPENFDFDKNDQYLFIDDTIPAIKVSPNGKILAYKNINVLSFIDLEHSLNFSYRYNDVKDFEFYSNEFICLLKIDKSFLNIAKVNQVKKKDLKKDFDEKNIKKYFNEFKIYIEDEKTNEKMLLNFDEIKISINKKYIALISISSEKKIVYILSSKTFKVINNHEIHINEGSYFSSCLNRSLIYESSVEKLNFLIKMMKFKNNDDYYVSIRNKISFTQDHIVVCNDLKLEFWSLKKDSILEYCKLNDYIIDFNKNIQVDYPIYVVGERNIVAYYPKTKMIKSWKINEKKSNNNSKELIKRIEIKEKNYIDNYIVHSLVVHPNNKILFVGDFENKISVIDIEKMSLIRKLSGHTDYVTSISIISKPNMIISSSLDNRIIIWDYIKSKEILIWDVKENHSNIIKLEFSIENNILITFSADCIKLWKYDLNKQKIDFDYPIKTIGITIDEECYTYKRYSNMLDKLFLKVDIFCITNKEIFICRSNLICSYDIESGKKNTNKDLKGHQSLIFILKNINNKQLASGSKDNTIIIWDIKKRNEIKIIEISNLSTFFVSFNLKLLITISLDKNKTDSILNFWDVKSKEKNNFNLIKSVKTNLNRIVELYMISDKLKLILGSIDKNIYLFMNNKIIEKKKLKINNGKLLNIFVYQDRFASVFHEKNYLNFKDIENESDILSIKLKKKHNFFDLKISIDDIGEKVVISYSNLIEIWSLYHKKKLIKIKNDEFTEMIFLSSNNNYLVVITLQRSLKIWKLNSRNPSFKKNEKLIESSKKLLISLDETRVIVLQYFKILIFSIDLDFINKIELCEENIILSTVIIEEKTNLIILKDGLVKIATIYDKNDPLQDKANQLNINFKIYNINQLSEEILNFIFLYNQENQENEKFLIVASTYSGIKLLHQIKGKEENKEISNNKNDNIKGETDDPYLEIDSRIGVSSIFCIKKEPLNFIKIMSYAKDSFLISKTLRSSLDNLIFTLITNNNHPTSSYKNYYTDQIKEIKFTTDKNVIILQNTLNEITIWNIEEEKKLNNVVIISDCWTNWEKNILFVEINDKKRLKLYAYEYNIIIQIKLESEEITTIYNKLSMLAFASEKEIIFLNNFDKNFHDIVLEKMFYKNLADLNSQIKYELKDNKKIIKICISLNNKDETEILYSTNSNHLLISKIEKEIISEPKSFKHSCSIINILITKVENKIILIDSKNFIIIFESNFMTIAYTIKSNYLNVNRISLDLSERLLLIHEFILDLVNNEEIAIIPFKKKDEFSFIYSDDSDKKKKTYYLINKGGIFQDDFWLDLFEYCLYNSILSQLFKNGPFYKKKNNIDKFRLPFLYSNIFHIITNPNIFLEYEEEIPEVSLSLFTQRNFMGRTCIESAISNKDTSLIMRLIRIFAYNSSILSKNLLNYNEIFHYLEFYSSSNYKELNFFDYLITIMESFGYDSFPICLLLDHSLLDIKIPDEFIVDSLDEPIYCYQDHMIQINENLIKELRKNKKFINYYFDNFILKNLVKIIQIIKIKIIPKIQTIKIIAKLNLYFKSILEKIMKTNKVRCKIKLQICFMKNILHFSNKSLHNFLNKIHDLYAFPNEIYKNKLLEFIIKYKWQKYYKYIHLFDFIYTAIFLAIFIINFNYIKPSRREYILVPQINDLLSKIIENTYITTINTLSIIISIILNILLIIYFVKMAIREIEQIKQRKIKYIYLITKEIDYWNIMDILLIIFGILSIIFDFLDLSETDTFLNHYKYIPSLTLALFCVKFISFLRGFEQTGYLIRLMIKVIKDIKYFLIFIILFNLSLTYSAHLLYKTPTNNQFETFDFFYRLMLGDFNDYKTFDDDVESHKLLWIFFVISTIFVTVILFNLLIAIISDSYEKFMHLENSAKNYELLSLILEEEFKEKKLKEIDNYLHAKKEGYFFNFSNDRIHTQVDYSERLRDVVEIINKKIGNYENENINDDLKNINEKINKINHNINEKISHLDNKIDFQINNLNNKIDSVFNISKKNQYINRIKKDKKI